MCQSTDERIEEILTYTVGKPSAIKKKQFVHVEHG